MPGMFVGWPITRVMFGPTHIMLIYNPTSIIKTIETISLFVIHKFPSSVVTRTLYSLEFLVRVCFGLLECLYDEDNIRLRGPTLGSIGEAFFAHLLEPSVNAFRVRMGTLWFNGCPTWLSAPVTFVSLVIGRVILSLHWNDMTKIEARASLTIQN